MFNKMVVPTGGEGGGGAELYFNNFYLNAQATPSWTNTPVEPTKVYFIFPFNNVQHIQSNVNPSTGEISDSTSWETTDGTNWTETTSYYFIRTSNSVALNGYVSGSYGLPIIFMLVDE